MEQERDDALSRLTRSRDSAWQTFRVVEPSPQVSRPQKLQRFELCLNLHHVAKPLGNVRRWLEQTCCAGQHGRSKHPTSSSSLSSSSVREPALLFTHLLASFPPKPHLHLISRVGSRVAPPAALPRVLGPERRTAHHSRSTLHTLNLLSGANAAGLTSTASLILHNDKLTPRAIWVPKTISLPTQALTKLRQPHSLRIVPPTCRAGVGTGRMSSNGKTLTPTQPMMVTLL